MLAEFKAWFEGFTEDMDERPTGKQWERVKARVKEIDGAATTYPVFVDRYFPTYPRYYGPYYAATGGIGLSSGSLNAASQYQNLQGLNSINGAVFDSKMALYAAGKADYLDLTAG